MTATATSVLGTTSEFSAPVAYGLTASGLIFDATVGVPFLGTVASFTRSDLVATAADFTATINFGDGNPSSAGTVVAAFGGFVVIGSGTYTTTNPATPVTVTITDTLAFSQATANSLANVVGAGGLLTPFGHSIEFIAGTLFSRVVAGFTDSMPLAFPGQFTAMINWEDPSRYVTLFSPDGQSLVVYIQDQGWELIETETWRSRIRFGGASGPAVFSPDSAILAHETYFKSYEGSIALVELATGRELARINDPDGAKAAQIVFSPDGTQLIAILQDQPHIRIWDLHAVRHRLAELDLDWSLPPAWGSAVPPNMDFELPPPLKYHVDRGQLDQWNKLAPIKRGEQAIADAEELLKHEPDQAEVSDWLAESCNNLAWDLVIGQESDRDPLQAVPLARRAVALVPDSDMFLNTLGLVLYRAGQHAEAIPVLERSLANNNNASAPYDLFFLALCHGKHGDAGQARAYFDRAVMWLKTNSKLVGQADQELTAFRAEAEALLHASFADLPDDVFAKVPEIRPN